MSIRGVVGFLLILITSCKSFSSSPLYVAIPANPNPKNETGDVSKSFIWDGYVSWLENVGIRVVPIQPWDSEEKIDEILSKVNGILLMGAERKININHNFEKHLFRIYEKAMDLNRKGDYFPVLAICFSFEAIVAHIAKDNSVVSNSKAMKIYITSKLDRDFRKRRLFSNFTPLDYEKYSNKRSTFQIHLRGIFPENFNKYERLTDFFDILSLGIDTNGKTFINAVEAKRYPVYGLQYHPEVNPYSIKESRENMNFNKKEALDISQLHALFFLKEIMKNEHKMTNEDFDKLGGISTYFRKKNNEHKNMNFNFSK